MQETEKKEREQEKCNDQVQDEDTIFASEEIVIEEMAIDGICGVY